MAKYTTKLSKTLDVSTVKSHTLSGFSGVRNEAFIPQVNLYEVCDSPGVNVLEYTA